MFRGLRGWRTVTRCLLLTGPCMRASQASVCKRACTLSYCACCLVVRAERQCANARARCIAVVLCRMSCCARSAPCCARCLVLHAALFCTLPCCARCRVVHAALLCTLSCCARCCVVHDVVHAALSYSTSSLDQGSCAVQGSVLLLAAPVHLHAPVIDSVKICRGTDERCAV